LIARLLLDIVACCCCLLLVSSLSWSISRQWPSHHHQQAAHQVGAAMQLVRHHRPTHSQWFVISLSVSLFGLRLSHRTIQPPTLSLNLFHTDEPWSWWSYLRDSHQHQLVRRGASIVGGLSLDLQEGSQSMEQRWMDWGIGRSTHPSISHQWWLDSSGYSPLPPKSWFSRLFGPSIWIRPDPSNVEDVGCCSDVVVTRRWPSLHNFSHQASWVPYRYCWSQYQLVEWLACINIERNWHSLAWDHRFVHWSIGPRSRSCVCRQSEQSEHHLSSTRTLSTSTSQVLEPSRKLGVILESTIDGATRIIEWTFLEFGASQSLWDQSLISSFVDLPTSVTHIPRH